MEDFLQIVFNVLAKPQGPLLHLSSLISYIYQTAFATADK